MQVPFFYRVRPKPFATLCVPLRSLQLIEPQRTRRGAEGRREYLSDCKLVLYLTFSPMEFDLQFSFGTIRIFREEMYADRPTLVFLHDSLGCIELWRDFPQKLAKKCQCNVLVYDRAGYGRSGPFTNAVRDKDYLEKEAHYLEEILAYCQIEKAILFGHSDGGSIALIAAALYPARIRGIITEGAHIFVEEVTLQGIREARLQYESTDLKKKLERYHGAKTEAMFRAWIQTWTAPFFLEWNIENLLPLIQCPALIIQGTEDEYGTPLQVKRIVEGIGPGAIPLLVPGVGHTPHKQAPGVILEAASSFINTIIS